MASVVERDKDYMVRVSYKDSNGNYHTKSKTGFKSEKAARRFGERMEDQIKDGSFFNTAPVKHPFAEYFNQWFEDFKRPKLAERTQQRYLITYHELADYFGNTPIEDVHRREYQRFITKYGNKHAKDTVQKVNSLIRACVRNAVYEDVIAKDFTKDITMVFDANRTRKIQYLNIDEIRRLTDYLLGRLSTDFTSNQIILTAIFTGMRPGEIQGLKWSDLNLNFKTINVTHSYDETTKDVIPTKNESSVRVVRINETLTDIFRQLEQNKKSDWVFMDQYGTVPTSNAINKTLRAAMAYLGIKRKGFHLYSLRHTHVAYLLSQGIDLYVISKRLGHSDISTTSRQYAYMIDEYRAKTDEQIEEHLDDLVDRNEVRGETKSGDFPPF